VLQFSLRVTDLDLSRKFSEGVLGLKLVEQSPRMVFLQTAEDYLIQAKGQPPDHIRHQQDVDVHHAFKVKPEDFQSSLDQLRQKGVEVFNIENRAAGVFWDPPAYFLDPDGNKLEIYAGHGAKVS